MLFVKIENAAKMKNEVNEIIEKYKKDGTKGVDLTPVEIVEIYTND